MPDAVSPGYLLEVLELMSARHYAGIRNTALVSGIQNGGYTADLRPGWSSCGELNRLCG